MEDTVCANRATLVDLHTCKERTLCANLHIVAHVALRIDLRAIADDYAIFNNYEVANITILADSSLLRNRSQLRDTPLLRLHRIVHIEQTQHTSVHIINLYERSLDRLLRLKIALNEHYRALRSIEILLKFRIRKVGQTTLLATLNRGYCIDRGVTITYNLTSQQAGNHHC